MPDGTFESLDVGTCQSTHVQLLSTDLHLFGVECKQSWWLLGVLITIALIKLFENWIYTKIGQLQRELMQIDVRKRTWTNEKIISLLFWEFVANVMGIVSVLFITGNNVLIWLTIVVFNCVGVVFAYTRVQADHHSTALELLNMLKTYNGVGSEHENTLQAIGMLRQVLDHHRRTYPNQQKLIVVDAVPTGSAKSPMAPDPDEIRYRKLHL